MEIKKLKIQTHTDDHGILRVINGADTVPFEIKRAFFTFEPTPNASRGGHANKTTSFLMINVAGHCRLRIDDGKDVRSLVLDSPDDCVLLPAMTWKEISDYSPDSVVLFLSDRHYDEYDYIYDYDQFLAASAHT